MLPPNSIPRPLSSHRLYIIVYKPIIKFLIQVLTTSEGSVLGCRLAPNYQQPQRSLSAARATVNLRVANVMMRIKLGRPLHPTVFLPRGEHEYRFPDD